MGPVFACRHFHEESNTAAVVTVALAELGLTEFDPDFRGQELVLHGLLQRGRFLEGRGLLLANALRYLSDCGVACQILHDASRTAALRDHLTTGHPGFDFRLLTDLGSPPSRPLLIEQDLVGGVPVILVESRHARGALPLHLLLVRGEGEQFHIMNSDTGENHICSSGQLARHLNSPVSFGAGAFAGRLYLFTGIAIRLVR